MNPILELPNGVIVPYLAARERMTMMMMARPFNQNGNHHYHLAIASRAEVLISSLPPLNPQITWASLWIIWNDSRKRKEDGDGLL